MDDEPNKSWHEKHQKWSDLIEEYKQKEIEADQAFEEFNRINIYVIERGYVFNFESQKWEKKVLSDEPIIRKNGNK